MNFELSWKLLRFNYISFWVFLVVADKKEPFRKYLVGCRVWVDCWKWSWVDSKIGFFEGSLKAFWNNLIGFAITELVSLARKIVEKFQ
jgi:hypothetical protein